MLTKTERQKALDNLIALGMTEAEAEQVLQDDEQIDQGAKLFELTDEQKEASKKARSTGTRKSGQTTRTRKEDTQKRELITMIFDLFRDTCVDDEPITEINVTNVERQIDFTYCGRKFRIILSAPRK